jgi:virulence-associated protein VapD
MKSIKLSYLFAMCAIVLVVLSITSCKKESDKNDILGTWKSYDNIAQILRRVTFREDSTSVFTASKVDNQMHVLYDLYRKEAKFSLKTTASKKLTFYNTVTYLNQDYENSTNKSTYAQTGSQNMVATPGTTTTVHSFMLNDGTMNLSMECSGTTTPTCFVGIWGYTRQ